MPSLPIRWIRATAYCHATEVEERVARALGVAVSGGAASRELLEGQFGNSMVVLSLRLDRAEDIRATWRRWAGAGVLRGLEPKLDARLDDEAVLHFRLDKQDAAAGSLSLLRGGDAIDVQVKLRAYPAKPAEIRRVAGVLLAGAV